jgi:serine/threonine protein kinase
MLLDAQNRVRLHGVDTRHDYFQLENIDYQALPLDSSDEQKGVGINSSVFRAAPAEDDGGSALIVKVCRFADAHPSEKAEARRKRFQREIDALHLSLEKGKQNLVVNIIKEGQVRVSSKWGNQSHQCFLMELASTDLRQFLTAQPDITFQQRLVLCADLVRSVRALHDIGVYHRDIKPENILLCNGGWKIGDLGLVAFRGEDLTAESREKIGPPSWMSPEAFNNAYCVQRPTNTFIDCTFDERSDVYQLGKICWYVIQGDIPNGCLKSADLVEGDANLFGGVLKPMLLYQRTERPLLAEVENRLTPFIRMHSI